MRDEPEGYNELTFNSLPILKSEHITETYTTKDIDSKEELFYNLYNSCLPYITECIENQNAFELVDFVEGIFEDAEEDLTLEFLIYCIKKDLQLMHHIFNYIEKEHEDSIKEQIEDFIEYKKSIDADISNVLERQS
jgi:spore coat polysaccharide biosynthesis protein SpsF (cytidylyltransferase family)